MKTVKLAIITSLLVAGSVFAATDKAAAPAAPAAKPTAAAPATPAADKKAKPAKKQKHKHKKQDGKAVPKK